jgi:hypothetical protein
MNEAGAWAKSFDGRGVNVAVLDSGVDFTHPDLAPAEVDNVKLAELGPPQPTQTIRLPKGQNSDTTSGHGTHVAGAVAGRGLKSSGKFKGMAYGAGLIGLGAGEVIEIFTALDGFDYVLAHQKDDAIRVITNSWGTDFAPFDPQDPINIATKKVNDAGIVVLFAAGNSYDEMTISPYAAPWVVTVAAGTKSGTVTAFSSAGFEVDTGPDPAFAGRDIAGDPRRPGALGLYHPSVTSTGENVVSTRSIATVVPFTGIAEDVGLEPGEVPYYTTLSGTSMATPETAGVVAQLLQANPALTPSNIKDVLETTARPISGVPFHKQGYGHTDATAAVETALALKDLGAAGVGSLKAAHDQRDEQVLASLRHPSHAMASTDPIDAGPTSVAKKFNVPAGTAAVKAAMVGPATIELNVVEWDITVTDAKGQPVGATANLPIPNLLSGAASIDIDLAKAATPLDKLAFGEWTFEFSSINAPAASVPIEGSLVTDLVSPPRIYEVIAAFDAAPTSCEPIDVFEATGSMPLRLQDDGAAGVPFPLNTKYHYIGAVRSGSLGTRAPKFVAAQFDVLTTLIPGPTPMWATPALTEPLTIGRGAAVRVFVQGKTDQLNGSFGATLVDIAPDGTPRTLGTLDGSVSVNEDASKPVETTAIIPLGGFSTIAAGHRLGLQLSVTFIGTTGNTIFYDSDEFASGVTLTTGRVVKESACGVMSDSSTAVPVVAPTSAAAPAPSGQLPATGGSSPATLVAIVALAGLTLQRARRVSRAAR